MPLVSVIIPTHNRASWVKEAVSSVLCQTFRDFELIVVDDGSQDATLEGVLEHFPKLVLLRWSKAKGVSAARNLGAWAARGEWLAFLDSDDVWLPEKLAQQVAYLRAHPGLALCQTEEIWVKNGRRFPQPLSHRKQEGNLFLASLERCVISPSAVMLRRRLFEEAGGFDESLPAAEDYDLWLRLTWRHPVGLVREPLVIKRGGHADQLSRQWGLDRYRIRALLKILAEGALPPDFRIAACQQLRRRCEIYARGCEKRGKTAEAVFYRNLAAGCGAGRWLLP